MASSPTHRSEATGNAGMDRIQNNVRDLILFARSLLARVSRTERQIGTATLATVDLAGKTDVTLSDAHFACGYWLFIGPITANCLVRAPRSTDATVWSRYVQNSTTGGFNVQIANGGSTSVLLAAASKKHVVATASGVETWP